MDKWLGENVWLKRSLTSTKLMTPKSLRNCHINRPKVMVVTEGIKARDKQSWKSTRQFVCTCDGVLGLQQMITKCWVVWPKNLFMVCFCYGKITFLHGLSLVLLFTHIYTHFIMYIMQALITIMTIYKGISMHLQNINIVLYKLHGTENTFKPTTCTLLPFQSKKFFWCFSGLTFFILHHYFLFFNLP